MSIKIKDIARLANVSNSTVSMVLNNKKGISEETKNKVLKIAQEHGYINNSNIITRNLNIQLCISSKHSKIVRETAFFHELIEGIESVTKNGSCKLIISYFPHASDLEKIVAQNNSNEIDGFLILGTEMNRQEAEVLSKLTNTNLPVIILDSYFSNVDAHYVKIDNIKSVYRGINHLIEMGHKEIGYLKGNVDIQNFKERYVGYTLALEESNLVKNEEYTVLLKPAMKDAYKDMVKYLSNKPKLPTAFIADNDNIAVGAMKALKEISVKIPDDISIVGFDDMPFASMMEPSLTTLKVDMKFIGEQAVKNLINLINSGHMQHIKTSIDTTLKKRHSVKPLN